MRWLVGLAMAGALVWAPGCTRTNPGFGADDESATDSTSTTGTPSTSAASASESSSTSTTTTSTTTNASDDTGGGWGSSSGSTGGYVACDGGAGFLNPTLFDDASNREITPSNASQSWAGDIESFDSGTLVIHPCVAGCDCGDTPALHFDLNQQPTETTLPACVRVTLVSNEDDARFDGFVIQASEGDTDLFYAGYDGEFVPPTLNDMLSNITVEWIDDSVRECGMYKNGCATDFVPGQYAMRYQSSQPIYPGEYTEPRSVNGRDFIFHNRLSNYSIDGVCGEASSWTMEYVGG